MPIRRQLIRDLLRHQAASPKDADAVKRCGSLQIEPSGNVSVTLPSFPAIAVVVHPDGSNSAYGPASNTSADTSNAFMQAVRDVSEGDTIYLLRDQIITVVDNIVVWSHKQFTE